MRRCAVLSVAILMLHATSAAKAAERDDNIERVSRCIGRSPYRVCFFRVADDSSVADRMNAMGRCAIRDGTNGWAWSDNETRETCLRTTKEVGLSKPDDWFHYPKETCALVSAAFSASSCNFDLNGEARTARTKQNSPIIPPA
jgi:hypothetical protein